MITVLTALLSYLAGSIPTGLLISKIQGIDPRKTGSGNIGATNVLRSAGRLSAFLTLVGDMGKGALAVVVSRYFSQDNLYYEEVAGLFAVIGHNYSIFLRFRGGKGVATSLGVLLMYSTIPGLITIAIWLATVFSTRYSSLGALISFGAVPFLLILDSPKKIPLGIIMTSLIFIRHRENIGRLMNKSEPKIGGKK